MADKLKLSVDIEDKMISYLKDRHAAAQRYYEEDIEPKVVERINVYHARESFYQKMFEKLSEISSLTSSDVADTIEWVMPSLMRIFFGGQSIIQIQGVQENDMQNAETMQELIDYQIQRRNKGFLLFHNWMKYALITNMAVTKCYWERETKPATYLQQMTQPEMDALMSKPNISMLEAVEIAPGLFNCKWQEDKVIKNQPVIDYLLASEFRFSPNARDVDDLDFAEHVQSMKLDTVRRKVKSGEYKNLSDDDEQKLDSLTYTRLDEESKRYSWAKDWDSNDDTPNKKVEIRETYIRYDVNGDGLLEDVIVWWSGDIILRVEENKMGRHPFFVLSPTLDPNQIFTERGFSEMIAQIQHLKTALLRLLVYNITLTNTPQAAVDMTKFQDIDDLLEGRQYWRVQGDPRAAVFPIPNSPIHPLTMPFMEFLEGQKENKTGITRYNQGVDANSLNKTATGVSMIMNAANQRLELIARIFAETGFVQLFKYLAMLNQLYVDADTTVRLTNKVLRINPANLVGDFDFVISAGIGTGTKEVNVQQLQLLLGMYPQLLQYGIAKPENVYKCVKKLIEEMGYKNTDDYITDPEEIAKEQAQQQPQAPQPLKISESLSIDFDKLPPVVKAMVFDKANGIQVSPEVFEQHDYTQAANKLQSDVTKVHANSIAKQNEAVHQGQIDTILGGGLSGGQGQVGAQSQTTGPGAAGGISGTDYGLLSGMA